MRAHIVQNGIVVNTIIVEGLDFDPGPGKSVIDGSTGGIGWAYVDGVLSPPLPEPEDQAERRTTFSVREFRQRFSVGEQMSIRAASFTDMEVGLTYDEFLSAQFIDVTDPAVAAGVDLYISKGLLLPSRRDELLSTANDREALA